MKALALALALPIMAQVPPGYYDSNRIVWYDKHDGHGSPWLDALDKRQHFAVGAFIGFNVRFIAEAAGLKHSWWYGFIAAAIVGIAKEVYDRKRWVFPGLEAKGSGTAEIMDAVWTGAGGAAGAYCMQIKFKF